MTNIFISWAKVQSREYAIELKKLLESLDPHLNVFMSEENILAGERVQEKIFEKITECDKLLICFTRENKRAPWLLYEAGFAYGQGKMVIPFLFDGDSDWHSWIDNPMNIAREIDINDENFHLDFIKCFNLSNSSYIREILNSFITKIKDIKEKYRQVDIECEDFINLLISNNAFHVESPIFKNKTAYFLTGFETFDLWKAIIHSFLYTGKYLWIYGRKNMKLFGGNFKNRKR